MIVARFTHSRREGINAIELVVVVAILGVVLALLLGGIMRLTRRSDVAQARSDIDQFESALEKFALDHNKHYPPSQILLSNDPSEYAKHPFGPRSKVLLQQLWPGIDLTKSHDWSGGLMKSKKGKDKYAEVLQGDQCLVFFLGGIPTLSPGKGCQGFGAGDRNPTDLRGKRIKPYFNFARDRLYHREGDHVFFSYRDPYLNGQPYAYFRSVTGGSLGGYSNTDCSELGVQPYFEKTATSNRYLMPQKFQIISAGFDRTFGPGGEYDPGGPLVTDANRAMKDDLANFHPEFLGTPK